MIEEILRLARNQAGQFDLQGMNATALTDLRRESERLQKACAAADATLLAAIFAEMESARTRREGPLSIDVDVTAQYDDNGSAFMSYAATGMTPSDEDAIETDSELRERIEEQFQAAFGRFVSSDVTYRFTITAEATKGLEANGDALQYLNALGSNSGTPTGRLLDAFAEAIPTTTLLGLANTTADEPVVTEYQVIERLRATVESLWPSGARTQLIKALASYDKAQQPTTHPWERFDIPAKDYHRCAEYLKRSGDGAFLGSGYYGSGDEGHTEEVDANGVDLDEETRVAFRRIVDALIEDYVGIENGDGGSVEIRMDGLGLRRSVSYVQSVEEPYEFVAPPASRQRRRAAAKTVPA